MDEILKKIILDGAKDMKIKKGSILDDAAVNEVKKKFMAMSDDNLLFEMMAKLGEFVSFLRSVDDAMKAYGLAAAYFLAEEEAKARDLYP